MFDPIRPESKIGLRVAGIAKCSGSDQDLKLFLRLLRSCVAAERNFEPRSPDQPEEISLTSAQFAAIQQEHERAAGSESEETLGVTLAKAYAFLYSESLYSTLRGDETGWTITLSRDIREYRRVQSTDDYLALVLPPISHEPSSPAGYPEPATVAGNSPAALNERPYAPILVTPASSSLEPDPRNVALFYGRDQEAHDALFGLLQDLGLQPLSWGKLRALTGTANPYTGQVVNVAFKVAQAVVRPVHSG